MTLQHKEYTNALNTKVNELLQHVDFVMEFSKSLTSQWMDVKDEIAAKSAQLQVLERQLSKVLEKLQLNQREKESDLEKQETLKKDVTRDDVSVIFLQTGKTTLTANIERANLECIRLQYTTESLDNQLIKSKNRVTTLADELKSQWNNANMT